MEAIILAGGFGTRLAQVVKDVPKPMAPVAGKPFLQYVADDLIAQGFDRLVFAVCYKKESIMNFFGSTYGGAEVLYSVEEEPLYTGGAICQALALCRDERVTVVNGDTFFGVDLAAMRRFAEDRGRQIVIAVREMRDFSRYGRVETNAAREVIAFHEKQPCAQGFINGGIYDLSRTSLEGYPQRFSMEEECFPKLLQSKQILAFPSDGLFIDIGIPKDYVRAQTLFGEAK